MIEFHQNTECRESPCFCFYLSHLFWHVLQTVYKENLFSLHVQLMTSQLKNCSPWWRHMPRLRQSRYITTYRTKSWKRIADTNKVETGIHTNSHAIKNPHVFTARDQNCHKMLQDLQGKAITKKAQFAGRYGMAWGQAECVGGEPVNWRAGISWDWTAVQAASVNLGQVKTAFLLHLCCLINASEVLP